MLVSGKFNEYQTLIGKTNNLIGLPIRVAILECIAQNKSCLNQDFLDRYEISMDVLKKNLRALNKGGILIRKFTGRAKSVEYSINWDKLNNYKLALDRYYFDIINQGKFVSKDESNGIMQS